MTQKNMNGNYESFLKDWVLQEQLSNEFINVIYKLFYDKSIELLFFKNQLIDRSSSMILYKHSYAENIIGRKLVVKDSLKLAKAIFHCDIKPSRIDIGKLNNDWVNERKNYLDVDDFITHKLKKFMNGTSEKVEKPKDVILFGFGRIGRLLARELVIQGNGEQLRLRAIVTRGNDAQQIIKRASLFRHDSIHGQFRGVAIEDIDNKSLYINGHQVLFLAADSPENIDYTEYGIKDAILIDNTGVFRDREGLSRHLKAKGVSQVLLTAPGKGDIPNIVYGVNQDEYEVEKEQVFSAASCTTNASVPVLSVIEKKYGIEKGHIETVHSYTNDQNLLDNFHKKTRRGRSAPLNLVITETGAAKAVAKAIPSLEGKLTGNAIRVPTPDVSLVIMSLSLKKEATVEEVNALMRKASLEGSLVEQIKYSSSADAVSSDFIGEPVTSIYDSLATKVSYDKKNLVMYVWYDNEYGYAMQVIRVAKYVSGVLRPAYF